MSDFNFDLSSVDETTAYPDRVVLPKGEYEAIINTVSWNDAKSGKGRYLRVDFLITEENFPAGIFVSSFLNLENESEEAKNIAMQDLKRMLIAGGADPLTFNDTQILVGLRMNLKLDVNGKYNNVKKYSPLSSKSGGISDLSNIDLSTKAKQLPFSDDDIPF